MSALSKMIARLRDADNVIRAGHLYARDLMLAAADLLERQLNQSSVIKEGSLHEFVTGLAQQRCAHGGDKNAPVWPCMPCAARSVLRGASPAPINPSCRDTRFVKHDAAGDPYCGACGEPIAPGSLPIAHSAAAEPCHQETPKVVLNCQHDLEKPGCTLLPSGFCAIQCTVCYRKWALGSQGSSVDKGAHFPTGECSWGCYYRADGQLVRDTACTVHGASR